MKKNAAVAALSAALVAVGAAVAHRLQQRRKVKALWQEATTQVGTNGSTPSQAMASVQANH